VEQRAHHAEISARRLEGVLGVVVVGVAVDGLGWALGAAVCLGVVVVVGQAQGRLRSGTGFGFGVCVVVIVVMVMVAVVLWTGMSVSAPQGSVLRKDSPCKNAAVMMFKPRPTQPMMRISFASSTFLIETKRSMDCRKMLTPSASRKAPLKKAPSRRARCQPKEKSWRYSVLFENCRKVSQGFEVAFIAVCGRSTYDDGHVGYDEANEVVQLQPMIVSIINGPLVEYPTYVVEGVSHESQTARLVGD
jgi:hypothetical protein